MVDTLKRIPKNPKYMSPKHCPKCYEVAGGVKISDMYFWHIKTEHSGKHHILVFKCKYCNHMYARDEWEAITVPEELLWLAEDSTKW